MPNKNLSLIIYDLVSTLKRHDLCILCLKRWLLFGYNVKHTHTHTYIRTRFMAYTKKPKHKSIRFETHELITFRRGEFSHKNKRSIDDANATATPTEIQNKEMKEKKIRLLVCNALWSCYCGSVHESIAHEGFFFQFEFILKSESSRWL